MLRSDVDVTPLVMLPREVQRGSDLQKMYEIGDYLRGVSLAATVDARTPPSIHDLVYLGKCELAAGRFDDARRHLRAALDLRPSWEVMGDIAWSLSQVEHLANNFAAAEEWAQMAASSGIGVKPWHLKYLNALANVEANKVAPGQKTSVPMKFGGPNIPRIDALINGTSKTQAVVDSGAVLSIISEEAATRMGVKRLGNFEGEFYGLLGEPIPVTFGLLDTLAIGSIVVSNVPVAIMPDRCLNFFVYNRQPFKMELLLGVNLLKEFRVELDFRDSTLSLTSLSDLDRVPAVNQNLFFHDFRPVVHTAINRRGWYLFVLDTGSEVTFLNQESLATAGLRGATGMHKSTLQGLGGTQKHGEKIEDVQIGVGSWAGIFRDIPLYENDANHAFGIIGQNLMMNFRVVIDFGTMRMELHRDRMFGT